MARELFNEDASAVFQSGQRLQRHTPHQIARLEQAFQSNHHPTDAQRNHLAGELGLTRNQIKFWFQNRRTMSKAQERRDEGIALRRQNEELKNENKKIQEILKSNYCLTCRTGQESMSVLEQLKDQNHKLHNEYRNLFKTLAKRRSSSDHCSYRDLLAAQMLGNNELVLPSKLENLVQETNNIQVFYDVGEAIAELSILIIVDELWTRDHVRGKYSINRKKYEEYMSWLLPMKNMGDHMTNINNLYNHHLQFESSKAQAIVKMNATQLVQMLMHPGMRHDLFPTLITKTKILQQMHVSSGLQLVYEQVHHPTPMLTPRDFYVLRYVDQVTERSWMIVDVSYKYYNYFMDDITANNKNSTGSLQWKFPSGCFIQDLCNGYSKVTWIEHVQVSEKFEHNLYKDLILGGFAYDAEKWVCALQMMCLRMDRENEGNTKRKREDLGFEECMMSMMKVSHGMVKRLCETLAMKQHVERVLIGGTGSRTVDLFFTINRGGIDQDDIRSIVSITTSISLPLPIEDVFNFLTDLKLRAKWDVLCERNSSQEIASASYGNDNRNRVSIIQPLISSESNIMILQEASFDHETAVVAYTPVNIQSLDLVLNGEDHSILTVLPSGFMISSANHLRYANEDGASTSRSSTTYVGCSLLTLAFQAVGNRDYNGVIEFPFGQTEIAMARSIIASTITNILGALNIE